MALSRTESPNRSVHCRHPRLFCFRSRRRRAVPPCLVRRERGGGFQLGKVLPYVLYRLRSTCIDHEDHRRSGNSASGPTYRTMRRVSCSFPFALLFQDLQFWSVLYNLYPFGVFSFVRSPLFRLVFRLVVFNPMFVAHFECSQWIESEWDPSMAIIASGLITSSEQINGRASTQTAS